MIKTSLISRLFGIFASIKFPKIIQKIINKSYVKFMNVDMLEFQQIDKYDSLNALFTRKLIKKREFDLASKTFISPCDSFITSCGTISFGQALQIKGFTYSVEELLSGKIKQSEKDKLEGGKYINFYLSPKDYHRYHSPADMQILRAVHIPGALYPVNLKWLRKIPSLFVENERVILECRTQENNLFYMIFVGALNVGKMSFVFDERIQTNSTKRFTTYYEYGDVFLNKGDNLGTFEMGSTIVMFFEKDFIKLLTTEGKNIRFGDVIATCQL
ncbi:MAG: phosphatidylserine decarboxylase [Campylobacteraceae bacterium]|nr:phosphatidylserine decarboxylase [Campylobacteraceae bacterium]